MSKHIVQGKETDIGDIVHFTDQGGRTHAAIIKHLEASPEGGHVAHLHVFSSAGPEHEPVENVPHSAVPGPHSWTHK